MTTLVPMVSARDELASPVNVLVVTVWSERFGRRRMVSHTDPRGDLLNSSALVRHNAPTDAAIVDTVRMWLSTIGNAAVTPGQRAPIRLLRSQPPEPGEGGGTGEGT